MAPTLCTTALGPVVLARAANGPRTRPPGEVRTLREGGSHRGSSEAAGTNFMCSVNHKTERTPLIQEGNLSPYGGTRDAKAPVVGEGGGRDDTKCWVS